MFDTLPLGGERSHRGGGGGGGANPHDGQGWLDEGGVYQCTYLQRPSDGRGPNRAGEGGTHHVENYRD